MGQRGPKIFRPEIELEHLQHVVSKIAALGGVGQRNFPTFACATLEVSLLISLTAQSS